LVRANHGAAGIDRQTIEDVERYGVSRMLDELAAELRDGRWRPLPARRVFIPKPGREQWRPLSIPALRDRVVQAAAKIVIEAVFEADFLSCSFGFRPGRATAASRCPTSSPSNARRGAASDCFESTSTDSTRRPSTVASNPRLTVSTSGSSGMTLVSRW
jgi:retron-type reverse transcriptase